MVNKEAANEVWLVVEDEPSIRLVVSTLIKMWGRTPLIFEDGHQAYKWLDQVQAGTYKEPLPELALLDIRMPEMSGLELQKKLIKDNIKIPIIIITGHGDVSLAVRAMKAGAVDFIEKPFNDQVLLDSISLALDKSIEVFDTQLDCADFYARIKKISPREQEVMDFLVEGKSTKEKFLLKIL